jgi:hypothetical protein
VVDGITLTLHSPKDVHYFKAFNILLNEKLAEPKSLRLNVFYNISLKGLDLEKWKVKKNIRWIKNCPLPEHEIFMKLF